MVHTSKEFKRVLNRELRLIIREARDGCIDCCKGYTCCVHMKLAADVCTNPKKYVEMTCVDGQWKSRRLIDI